MGILSWYIGVLPTLMKSLRRARIHLTGSTLAENSTEGTAIAIASVNGLSGPFTWTLSNVNPANALKLSGTNPANTIAIQAGATPVDREVTMAVPFTLVANDGGKTVTITGTISVTDINESAPIITSNGGGATASINVNENTTAVTTVVASDADATAVIAYAIVGGDDSSLFQIDASTGVLSFKAAPNYEAPSDANADNTYIVVVQASDGLRTVNQTITATIVNVIEVPVITAASIVGSASVGSILSLSINASDMAAGSYAYQWQIDGAAITGATSATYTVASLDLYGTITCAITPTNTAGTGTTVVTASVGPVAPGSAWPSSSFTAAGGIMVLDAEDNHGEAAIIQTFSPFDVDTSANTIALADRGFNVYTTVSSAKATRGWFGTTGVLPAIAGSTLIPGSEGNPGTIVYRVDLGAGRAQFYREASDADHAVIPSSIEGELVSIAQRYAEAVDPIDFLDGGTGTHTFYTYPITNTLTTKVGGHTVTARDMADPNTWIEIVTISGKRYFFNDRSSHDPQWGAYRRFGKGPVWQSGALSQAGANKRWLWQIACINLPTDADRALPKIRVVDGVGVDLSANTITMTHPFVTGDLVKMKVKPGSTLPSGSVTIGTPPDDTTYTFSGSDGAYVNVVGNAFTLHRTKADALAGTNPFDLTSAGGTYIVYALARPGDSVQSRMRFISEYGDMSGTTSYNALTARTLAETSEYAATSVSASGSTAGQITGSPWLVDGERMRAWFPPGTVAMTRADTGLPLAAGTYYASMTPGGGSIRLHDTLQSAIESIGVATVSCSCIKFSAQGSGNFSLFYEDTVNGRLSTLGNREFQASRRIPNNVNVVWASGVDMNKPGETYFHVYHGVNTAIVEDDLLTDIPVQNTGNYQAGAKPGVLFNSIASHVSLGGYMSALCWFAGTGDPDTASMQVIMDWMATRNNARITATNTSLPTINVDPVPGTQIVGQVGGWSGPRPWTFTFQWQSADDAAGTNAVDIAGATSIRYTPTVADINKHLRLKTSVTNRSGTTSAYSAWSNAVENDTGEAETAAFMSRLSAEPVAGFRPLLKACYAALINAAALIPHDSLLAPFIYGVPTVGGGALTVADALLNLAGNTSGSVVGTLTWTPKVGAEATDGTSYISHGLDPSTGALKYQRNSATIWHIEATTPSGNTTASNRNTNARVNLNPRLGTGTSTLQLNATSATYTSAVQTYWTGFWCGLRRSSSAVDFIHDDVTLVADWAQPSQQVTTGVMILGPKNGCKACGGIGSGITIAQSQQIRLALEAFRAGVAAL